MKNYLTKEKNISLTNPIMKRLRTIFKYIFLCAIISTMATSCSKDDDPATPTSISISTVSTPLNIGETKQLVATILPENSIDKSITWLSSDIEIATVDANGLVTCINSGDVRIQASTSNNIKTNIKITIEEPKFIIPVELVGNWVGVEFNFYDTENEEIYDEETLKEEFMSDEEKPMTEEEFEAWIVGARSTFGFIARADGTMEWPAKLGDGTIVKVGGVLSRKEDLDNTYIGSFDLNAAGLVGDIREYEFEYIDSRIKFEFVWSGSLHGIIYFNVVKSSSNMSTKSKCNILVPEKFRRK